MISYESALATLLDALVPLAAITLPVADCNGLVLAEDVLAAADLPPFDQSALDGYAARLEDCGDPQRCLPVVGHLAAGRQASRPHLTSGTVQRIFTGAVLPEGADVVVAQEHTAAEGEGIRVLRAPRPEGGARRQGEELRRGAPLAPAGARVTPALAAAASMAGVATLTVVPRPKVVVLVTGDEIVAPGRPLALGEVYDANGVLLHTWLAEEGCTLLRLEYVADSAEAVRQALSRAAADADLVLTSGGVSVGEHDHLPAESAALGATRLFWKVAQKPGKPVLAARMGTALLLALPGNPAAVLVNLTAFARPALQRLRGMGNAAPTWQRGRLTAATRADADRGQWLRVAVTADTQGFALRPLTGQASHMLSNSREAEGLAWIAPAAALDAGADCCWLPLAAGAFWSAPR